MEIPADMLKFIPTGCIGRFYKSCEQLNRIIWCCISRIAPVTIIETRKPVLRALRRMLVADTTFPAHNEPEAAKPRAAATEQVPFAID